MTTAGRLFSRQETGLCRDGGDTVIVQLRSRIAWRSQHSGFEFGCDKVAKRSMSNITEDENPLHIDGPPLQACFRGSARLKHGATREEYGGAGSGPKAI